MRPKVYVLLFIAPWFPVFGVFWSTVIGVFCICILILFVTHPRLFLYLPPMVHGISSYTPAVQQKRTTKTSTKTFILYCHLLMT